MNAADDQHQRIEAIVGDSKDFDAAVTQFFEYLQNSLEFPCEVTGLEDFDWEEFYVLGPGDLDEYEQLKKTQPSYTERYDLLALEREGFSQWMLFDEDLAAHVSRQSDGQEFILGLAELEVVDKKSRNYQLLDDYVVFFVNNR